MYELTTEGIIFVSFAWSCVTGLVVFCFWKVMRGNRELKQ